ncbi:hypothetical protein [Thiomicrospira sp. ALE5]|uniref:hypothetical protein n=1 Tax=Thiomicrospira sp. ALE5 TaxID=748650 RepID=UPI0008E3E760|nr:hypothetical protein [Thiomicrospira sp. ALE5]SFR59399.1 hypothetical protein SAMN03092900_1480 [Thiomicrospira sp. ALE5]
MPTHSNIKLLITARDPATALSFQVLIPQLAANSDFDIQVLAQFPASELLNAHHSIRIFDAETSLESQINKLSEFCDTFQPDAVLTGISGPDAGVDEVALIWAERHGVPSYALQSYWGDINPLIDIFPNTVFVLDQLAVELTRKRYPAIDCIPVGSIKHNEFEGFDALASRHLLRPGLVAEGQVLLGFYGQPLEDNPGYIKTLERLAEQLHVWSRPFKVMYRPHPKESKVLRRKTFALLEQAVGARVFFDPGLELKQSLSVCDLVVSAFSTCGFDALHLNKISPRAFSSSVYLWFEPELIEWWQSYNQLKNDPLLDTGMILCADNNTELLETFEKGIDPSFQKEVRLKALEYFPESNDGCKKIIETISNLQKK